MSSILTSSYLGRYLGSSVLGAVAVLAFAPFSWYPVNWLTLAGLFGLLCGEVDGERRWQQGAALAGCFAFGLFVAGVSWVYVSLSVFGGMPTILAGLATLLFCAALAAFAAVVGALFVRFSAPGVYQRTALFAGMWTLAEWFRSTAFTGFPWLAAGYSQVPPSPLAGYAPVFGVFGVSLLSALLGALLFEVGRPWLAPPHGSSSKRPTWRVVLPMILLLLLLLVGDQLGERRWTQTEGPPLSVALLQGNVAQEMKWRPERFTESLRTYHRLAQEHPAQLTILPETALPAFLEQIPADYLEALQRLALRRQGDLLLGVVDSEEGQYVNAAVSLGVSGQQRYSKTHLVPFGEFVPRGFSWFMTLIDIPLSNFARGTPGQPPLRLAGRRVGVNICYEDAFGDEVIGALPTATLLVNISNVAWFGDSLAPAQHLQIAQMRALESGRMMLRATNTGMTAIVDVDGRVRSVLAPFTRAALTGEAQAYTGTTPFVRWGNWPALAIAGLLVLFGIAYASESAVRRV